MDQAGHNLLSGESLAEQFRHNVLTIKLLAESQESTVESRQIIIQADATLRFIEAYILASSVRRTKVVLEPANLSAILFDVATSLKPIAKLYDFDIDVMPNRHAKPAVTSAAMLEQALYSIGYTLITSSHTKQKKIILKAKHHREDEMVAIASPDVRISQRDLQKSRLFKGEATIPMANSFFTSASGIYVAEELFLALSSRLHIVKDKKMSEIGGRFSPARQLNFLPSLV